MEIFKPWFIVPFVAIVVSIYNAEARLIGNAFKRADDDTLISGSTIINTRKNCKPFYDDLLKHTGEQFSMFWVGNEDYSKNFMAGFEKENLKTGNYFVAARPLEKPTTPPPTTATASTSATPTPTTTTTTTTTEITPTTATTVQTTRSTRAPSNAHHSEPIALAKAEAVIAKYTTDKGAVQPPDVFLYTLNSPCFRTGSVRGSCAKSIAEWAQKHKNSIRYLFVAWDKQYVNNNEEQFLNGLVKLTEEDNVKIMYPTDGHFCIPGKDRPWLQRAVYTCLTKNVKVKFGIPGCKDAGIFRRDLAKLINRIVWRCGMEAPIGRIRDRKCWETKAKQILGQNGIWLKGVEKDSKPDNERRMNQLQEWRKVFDKSLSDCVGTRGTDIGPAISPKEPGTPSSSAEETKGLDGRDNELCFANKDQSGNLGAAANGKK